ncbi:M16 family metallopeptidase [Oceanibium sediminis]|uniref:M16 family metallopeptidase n=1 Tax=Oceanibium sediminis TaxID=2026339 RepID=UPI000DD49196|nr:pitrilysin family protein [Oceanibium sediminis]
MKFLFVLSFLLLPAAAWASSPGAVTTSRLDNGLEIVVIEDHRAPVVTHMLWYRVGAGDDPMGKSGIAHFLEHLLFKGTEKFPGDRFQANVAANGGSDNAFTSYDYTGYFQRVAADRLDLMMEMEADRMRKLVLTPEDVATERDVILEERRSQVERSPGGLFNEQMRAAIYLNNPKGRPIIGWEHEIRDLQLEDALAFYRRYYAPNNAILIVAGDVEPDAVFALAETHYGPLEPTQGLEPRARPSEPPQRAERRLTYRDARVRQPYLSRSYLAPSRRAGNNADAAALSVLARLLGGSVTSFLVQRLEVEEKVMISVGAAYGPNGLDGSTFGLYAAPVDGVSLEQAAAALDRAVADFLDQGPDLEALERVKAGIRASEIYALDSQQSRARAYGSALTSGLTVEDVASWTDALDAVTAEDVIAAGRAVFRRESSVTGYVLPEEGAE